MTPAPRRLWHYCCRHSIGTILAMDGKLVPNPMAGLQPKSSDLAGYPVMALPVIWLTDIDVRCDEDQAAIGLEGLFTTCDRVEYRFVVKAPNAAWWPEWADANVTDLGWRRLLEWRRSPERWWVSEVPIGGTRLDDAYVRPVKEEA